MRHTVHKLIKKERIIRLNRNKYYLVPIKAKTGKWYENSFILVDEVMDGKDYFIGGWSAAHYWGLTEQIPLKIEVYSDKRQGLKKYLTTTIIFRRTSEKRLKKVITRTNKGHAFKILSKKETEKWMESRN
ncbi:MAG: hypothetical protein ABIE94_04670 [archaeon]